MTIGILKLVIFIPQSNSLKEKRMILNSLNKRLRNNFNIAVTQIDNEDKWQKSTLALVGVEKNKDNMHRLLSRILNFIENFHQAHLIDYEMELI